MRDYHNLTISTEKCNILKYHLSDMRLKRQPIFAPMLAITGTITYWCPYCGTMQKIKAIPGRYRITCTNGECGITLEWGTIVRPPCTGKGKPPDTIMDLAPIRLSLWRKRRLSARDWMNDRDELTKVDYLDNAAAGSDDSADDGCQADRRDP